MQYGNPDVEKKEEYIEQFKSYYVVWKRSAPRFVTVILIGLNRTMQYGNFENFVGLSAQLSEFKSYYVVWKPISSQHDN